MADALMCNCGRLELDGEYEVRVDWRGVHAANSCDLDEREFPNG